MNEEKAKLLLKIKKFEERNNQMSLLAIMATIIALSPFLINSTQLNFIAITIFLFSAISIAIGYLIFKLIKQY